MNGAISKVDNWNIEKEFLIDCIKEFVQIPEVIDAINKNLQDNSGLEENISIYLCSLIFRKLLCLVPETSSLYVGCKKFPGENNKMTKGKAVDCVVQYEEVSIGIELKGPSKDNAYVVNGVTADKEKLDDLIKCGHLTKGFSVGIILNKSLGTNTKKKLCNFHIREIKSSELKDICMIICIIET